MDGQSIYVKPTRPPAFACVGGMALAREGSPHGAGSALSYLIPDGTQPAGLFSLSAYKSKFP